MHYRRIIIAIDTMHDTSLVIICVQIIGGILYAHLMQLRPCVSIVWYFPQWEKFAQQSHECMCTKLHRAQSSVGSMGLK